VDVVSTMIVSVFGLEVDEERLIVFWQHNSFLAVHLSVLLKAVYYKRAQDLR
jgi:hypothetical protein